MFGHGSGSLSITADRDRVHHVFSPHAERTQAQQSSHAAGLAEGLGCFGAGSHLQSEGPGRAEEYHYTPSNNVILSLSQL